jgi:hypothetical protein
MAWNDNMVTVVGGGIVSVVTLVFGYFTARAANRKDMLTTYLQQVAQDNMTLRQRMDEELTQLRAEVAQLEDDVRMWRDKYFALEEEVRVWREHSLVWEKEKQQLISRISELEDELRRFKGGT